MPLEVFLDFGLFELASAAFLALLTRWIFRRRLTAAVFLAISVAAPAGILVVLPTSAHRMLAVATLVASVISASALAMIVLYCPEAFDTATNRGLAMAEKAFPRIARFKAFQAVRRLMAPRS